MRWELEDDSEKPLVENGYMAMAASLAAHHHHGHLAAGLLSTPRASGRANRSGVTISMKAQKKQGSEPGSAKGGGDGRVSGGRPVWRRRKLTKEDDMLRYKLDRIPFLEESEKSKGKREDHMLGHQPADVISREYICIDAFTMEVAEEANFYLEKNRHEYGLKKPILHVLSDHMNEAGFSQPEGYLYPYPIKPGPYFIKGGH